MSFVRSIRIAASFAFAFSLAACSGNSSSPTPHPISSASAAPGGGNPNSIPGGGLGGGTNIAYVPGYVDQNVYIFNFGTGAFALLPIVGTPGSSSASSVYGQGAAISADGHTLYGFSFANSGPGTISASTVGATGATSLGSVSATFGDHDQVVPSASTGNVYAFTRSPSNGSATLVAEYSSTLATTVVPPTTLPISGTFEFGATNPTNGNAYVVDGVGNLYEIAGATVLSSVSGVSTSPEANSAIDGQQLVAVNPNGRFVYTYQENSTSTNAYIDVFSVSPLALVTQIPVPFTFATDLLPNLAQNALYVVGGETVAGSGVTAIAKIDLTANTLGTVSPLQGVTGSDTNALSADGTKLLVQGDASNNTLYSTFNTSTGAQLGSATIPGTGAYAATGFITTH
jgi:hypothetical protein